MAKTIWHTLIHMLLADFALKFTCYIHQLVSTQMFFGVRYYHLFYLYYFSPPKEIREDKRFGHLNTSLRNGFSFEKYRNNAMSLRKTKTFLHKLVSTSIISHIFHWLFVFYFEPGNTKNEFWRDRFNIGHRGPWN